MTRSIDTMVEDTANALLGDLSEQSVLEAAEGGEWPAKLWAAATEAGLPMALDEGLDGLPAAAAVARATGSHPAPIPLVETVLARGLAHLAGIGWPEGPATLAPPRTSEIKAAREAHGLRIKGTLGAVPFGRWCHQVVVASGGHVAVLDAKALKWTGTRGYSDNAYSGEPLDNADVDILVQTGSFGKLEADADALGALLRSFQMAGGMRAAVAITLQYANDRVQFGRAIGKFQALQHLLAEMAESAVAADTAASMALDAWGTSRGRLMLATAKIRCGEAAGIVAAGAHQIHGAIGFTREHRLHHITRRLWTWRDEFGHEGEWAVELGRLALAHGQKGLWPMITG